MVCTRHTLDWSWNHLVYDDKPFTEQKNETILPIFYCFVFSVIILFYLRGKMGKETKQKNKLERKYYYHSTVDGLRDIDKGCGIYGMYVFCSQKC